MLSSHPSEEKTRKHTVPQRTHISCFVLPAALGRPSKEHQTIPCCRWFPSSMVTSPLLSLCVSGVTARAGGCALLEFTSPTRWHLPVPLELAGPQLCSNKQKCVPKTWAGSCNFHAWQSSSFLLAGSTPSLCQWWQMQQPGWDQWFS